MSLVSQRCMRFFICLVYIASLTVHAGRCMTTSEMETSIAGLSTDDQQKVRDLWGFIEEKRREGTSDRALESLRSDLIESIGTMKQESQPRILKLAGWTAGIGAGGAVVWRYLATEFFKSTAPLLSVRYLAPVAVIAGVGGLLVHSIQGVDARRRLMTSMEGMQGRFEALHPGTYTARSSWQLGFGDAWTPTRRPQPATTASPRPVSQPGPAATVDDPWEGHNRGE